MRKEICEEDLGGTYDSSAGRCFGPESNEAMLVKEMACEMIGGSFNSTEKRCESLNIHPSSATSNALTAEGSVKVGTGGDCNGDSHKGTLKYNSSTNQMEYCDGSEWKKLGGGGGARNFVNWGATSCPSNYQRLYSGNMFSSSFEWGGGGTGDLICISGIKRGVARYSNDWITQPCAVCAHQDEKICFTYWGGSSCPTGFSAVKSGAIFQTFRTMPNWSGTGGKMVCSSIPSKKLCVVNYAYNGHNWINPPSCVVCCKDD